MKYRLADVFIAILFLTVNQAFSRYLTSNRFSPVILGVRQKRLVEISVELDRKMNGVRQNG